MKWSNFELNLKFQTIITYCIYVYVIVCGQHPMNQLKCDALKEFATKKTVDVQFLSNYCIIFISVLFTISKETVALIVR